MPSVINTLTAVPAMSMVAAGPLFQPIRGALFGIVIYLLRDLILERKRGWLTLWAVLAIVGVISPFGAAPASIEGMIYTTLPLWFHINAFPEILLQSLLLALVATMPVDVSAPTTAAIVAAVNANTLTAGAARWAEEGNAPTFTVEAVGDALTAAGYTWTGSLWEYAGE
jgi:hypothetical protein